MVKINESVFIHPTADVAKSALIGKGTKIWHQSQIRENAKLGQNCVIGKGVYIDKATVLGNNVKIQNYSSLYYQTTVEDGVFIGPYVCLTNDKLPRAVNPDGTIKSESDWNAGKTVIHKGASIGTGSILLPDIEVGEYAMVGAASLVTIDVAPHALVYGVPAVLKGYVCRCGTVISRGRKKPKSFKCEECKKNNRW